MTFNSKKTSPSIAAQASATLRDKNASAIAKTLAASALSQADSSRQTGKDMEATASKVLQSEKYNDANKALAASVLAQSNHER